MKGPEILVTGIGGPAGRAVSGYLQEKGFGVLATDMRKLDGVSNFRTLPPALDTGFIATLLSILDEERVRLLVPTVTEELPKITLQRDLIRGKGCAIYVCAPDATETANDKWKTARRLQDAGVSVPRSYCGTDRPALLGALSFPMLSRPRVGRGGRGVVIHPGPDDVPPFISSDRIFQEFLPGAEYDVNLFADRNGQSLATIVLRKKGLKDGLVGNAVSVERVRDTEIANLAEQAASALRLEGPIDMDIRRGADGRPAILEINARFGANVRFAEEGLETMLTCWRNGC